MNDLAIKECIVWLELAIDQIEAKGDPHMAVVIIKKVLGILGSIPSDDMTGRGGGFVRFWPAMINEDGSVTLNLWQLEKMLDRLKGCVEETNESK